MQKIFLKILSIGLLTFSVNSFAENIALNSASRDNPPHYTITNNQMSGYDYELAKVIFSKAGIDVNYNPEDPSVWEEILDQIKTGQRDFIGQATDTKEREHWAWFSKAYRDDSNSVIARSSAASKFTDAAGFVKYIKSNKDLVLGIVDATIYNSDEINDLIKNPEDSILVGRRSPEQLMTLLDNNEVDYIIINTLSAVTLLSQKEDSKDYKIIDIKAVLPIHFMFSKKTVSQDIVNKIDKAISDSTQEIDAIYKKYHSY